MKKNLILTAASGYGYCDLKPFFKTLQNTKYQGDTVLFYNSLQKDTSEKLQKYPIKQIQFSNTFPYSENQNLNKHIELNNNGEFLTKTLRYVLYRAYLKEFGKNYKYVLLTDVRDVIFQKDPFDYQFQEGLTTFLEDKSQTIKTNFYNSQWIRDGFGHDVLGNIGNNYISCSGVTYGDVTSVIKYIEEMIPLIIRLQGKNCRDQGIHNYLIYEKKLPFIHLINDDEGPVSTISLSKKNNSIKVDKDGYVLDNHKNIINIVHQYDRHWKLLKKYNKPGYRRNKINMIKKALYFIWKNRKLSKALKNLKRILFEDKIPVFDWD